MAEHRLFFDPATRALLGHSVTAGVSFAGAVVLAVASNDPRLPDLFAGGAVTAIGDPITDWTVVVTPSPPPALAAEDVFAWARDEINGLREQAGLARYKDTEALAAARRKRDTEWKGR